MKKLLFTLSIFSIIALASCSKSYECACYDDATGNLISTTTIKARGAVDATVDCSARTNHLQTCYLN